MHNVSQDEQRHIGFGVKLLRDLALEDPEVPDAVADLLREVLPFIGRRVRSPGLGPPLLGVLRVHARGDLRGGRAVVRVEDARRRAAGGGPARAAALPDRPAAARARAARDGAAAEGILGQKNGPPARDAETMALLFDTVRRGVDFRTAPAGPLTVQWDFTDAEAWHLRLDNGSTAVAPGRVEAPDIVFRARYEDFVDVVGGRLDPRRAMATGRLRPRGSLRTLWSARGSSTLTGARRTVRRLVPSRPRR